MALPRRPFAHGRLPLRSLRAARPCGYRRPLTLARLDEGRDAVRLRLRARDRRRPLPARLRRTPPRRESADRDRLCRAGACLLRAARHQRQAVDDRQRLQLHQEPPTTRAPGRAGNPSPEDPALPPAHEREGRALPPDDGARVGLRPRLPLTSTAQPSAATLARALQHAPTAQLARRPTPDQPRAQRPWVGQLVTRHNRVTRVTPGKGAAVPVDAPSSVDIQVGIAARDPANKTTGESIRLHSAHL